MKILYPFKDTHKSCIDLTVEAVSVLIVFSVPLVLSFQKQSLFSESGYWVHVLTGTDSGTALFTDASWFRYQPTLSEAGSENSLKMTLAITYTHHLKPEENARSFCMTACYVTSHYIEASHLINFKNSIWLGCVGPDSSGIT